MAAARPDTVDLLGEFDDDEKIPWKLSIKNTVKIKLYSNILANRKSYVMTLLLRPHDLRRTITYIHTRQAAAGAVARTHAHGAHGASEHAGFPRTEIPLRCHVSILGQFARLM